MSEKRLSEIKEETAKENTLQRLKTTIIQGWPNERAEVVEELHDTALEPHAEMSCPFMIRWYTKANKLLYQ